MFKNSVLLVGALVVAALLAYQAIDAGRSHAEVAEKSVREQANFAAWQYTRNAREFLAGKVLYPGVEVTAKIGGKDGSVPLIWSEFVAAAEDRDWSPDVAAIVFRADLATGDLDLIAATDPPNAADVERLSDWVGNDLIGQVARGIAEGWEPVLAPLAGTESSVVYRLFPENRSEAAVAYGFEILHPHLSSVLALAFTESPLLPEAVTGDRENAELFFVTVEDAQGRLVWASDSTYRSEYTARDTMGVTYGGLTTSVVINPKVAPSLVIGGLPRQRLPLIFALLALSGGLVATALVQMRRESELAELRADFVSGVSHELRTPLAQIRMFSETLLLGRVRSEEERHRSLEIIVNESQRLTHQVDNVLLYSRGERQGTRCDPAPVDPGGLVAEVVEGFEPLALAAGSSVALDIADLPPVNLDGALVRQALLNLLDNAVKYGNEGQVVRVGLDRAGVGGVRLWVEDEGPGVSESERRRIFEPYHRLSRHRDSAVAGSGIGLAVVREVARVHGGSARVEPGSKGGARFVIELPPALVGVAKGAT